jgi:hypothetical protein
MTNSTRLTIPNGAFKQEEPFLSIGKKWISYAQEECDVNDIATAIWSAIKDVQNELIVNKSLGVCTKFAMCDNLAFEDREKILNIK